MEQELTLNQAWSLCLRQWLWIIEQLDAGSTEDVVELKEQWLRLYDYVNVEGDCFFCEYTYQQMKDCDGKFGGCPGCPGKLVSKPFGCTRITYNYSFQPRRFYAKLLKLNEKRQNNDK